MFAGPDITLAVLSIFLPTIIGSLGYEAAIADLLTAPVYASAYICLLLMAWISDRFQKRGLPITFGCILSGLGYILLCFVEGPEARYGCTFMVAIVSSPTQMDSIIVSLIKSQGCYIAFPIVLAWVLSTFAADTKGGMGVSMVIAISHAVGIAASYMYPATQAPRYLHGNAAAGSLAFASGIAAFIIMFVLLAENRRRDRRYGRPERNAPIQMTGEADNTEDFRYVL